MNLDDILSVEGSEFVPGQEPLIAPGVRGCVIKRDDAYFIPMIAAATPGSGDVSQFIKALPGDRRIIFTTVVNPLLENMLWRAGFRPVVLNDPEMGDFDAWERTPQKTTLRTV